MASQQNRTRRNQSEAARRYEEAADAAIGQLDWCINYLRQIRKPAIARALQNNRAKIVERYRG